MSEQINMNDLPLVSKTGWWIVLVGAQRKRTKTDVNTFRVKLKAATMNLETCKQNFAPDSRMGKKAQRAYDFLYNQIDQEQSDTFALMMYDTEDWVL